MRVLITGCAGFIGYHLCLKLLNNKNYQVFGIDNINNYYDVKIKKNRLSNLKKKSEKFKFYKNDICNLNFLNRNFKNNNYDYVIHLAAQAGVRHSIKFPADYMKSNLKGFFNILEVCKKNKIKHLIYASSSSVYGSNKNFPLKESANTDFPLSFYAATKKSNEIMAHAYSHIYKLPCTGLRFFTVYGPEGRPDQSLYLFTKAIMDFNKVKLFNKGNHIRDFTYVDDVVSAIIKLIKMPPKFYAIFNIASAKPQNLKFYLNIIEKTIGRKAKITYQAMQLGDIYKTHGNIRLLFNKIRYKPKTNIIDGIEKFVKWYKNK